MRKIMPHRTASAAIGVCLTILSIALAPNACAQAEPVIVNVENFVRAETAAQFDRVVENAGGVNRFFHLREPAPLDKQTVIRMNRDTIYSSAVVDISKGATLTVPDAGDRYMSIMVVNEDHYLNKVMETMSAMPIEDNVFISLVVVARQGMTALQMGNEITPVNER